MKESAGLPELTRFLRIQSTRQDSPVSGRFFESDRLIESDRLLESDGYSPTAFYQRAIALHSLPQLEGLSRVAYLIVKRLSGLYRVRGLIIVRAQSPFLVTVV